VKTEQFNSSIQLTQQLLVQSSFNLVPPLLLMLNTVSQLLVQTL